MAGNVVRLRSNTLSLRDASDLQGKDIPKRDWLIPSVAIRKSVTLFAGDGGVGKSLACQMMQVAAALGLDWLGFPMNCGPITSIGVYCEDDDDELDRRFADICKHYGAEFSDLDGRVKYISRVGQDNEMIGFRGRGDNPKLVETQFLLEVEDLIDQWGVELTILDTISDVFGGNENYRYQVKTGVSRLRRCTLKNRGSLIINAHPSKSSMSDGSYFSGSTAWHGAVRNRLYLSRPKKKRDEGEDEDFGDDRVLRVMKSNYSQAGERVYCKWEAGAFVLPASARSMFDKLELERKLLDATRYLVNNGSMPAMEQTARTSLMALARSLPSCADIPFRTLQTIRDGLIEKGSLEVVELGPRTKRRKYVRTTDTRLVGEKGDLL